jgi:hypothetical protein
LKKELLSNHATFKESLETSRKMWNSFAFLSVELPQIIQEIGETINNPQLTKKWNKFHKNFKRLRFVNEADRLSFIYKDLEFFDSNISNLDFTTTIQENIINYLVLKPQGDFSRAVRIMRAKIDGFSPQAKKFFEEQFLIASPKVNEVLAKKQKQIEQHKSLLFTMLREYQVNHEQLLGDIRYNQYLLRKAEIRTKRQELNFCGLRELINHPDITQESKNHIMGASLAGAVLNHGVKSWGHIKSWGQA